MNKGTRPSLTKVFPRKRLFSLLDDLQKQEVIWVSGPAGSGKTTVVSNYIETRKTSCLWYQVEEGDSDPATFFYHLGRISKFNSPRKRIPLPLLTPEYLQDIPTFARRYFENLFSRLKVPGVVVFDNYQQVPFDSPLHEIILYGLSEIPKNIKVILISRSEPPPVLIRLLANNQMEVLGGRKLRLTLEESKDLIRLKSRKKLSQKLQTQLHRFTEGWAAGLVLMLVSFESGLEPQVPAKGTPEEIFDYFGRELFNKMDKALQEFYLKTAFLPKMTGRMAEILTGLSSAHRILNTMGRNNNFIEKRILKETVYQYHSLFRNFLLLRARETFSRDVLFTLLRRAALLLEEDGQTEAAFELFHELCDWGAMIQIILKQAPALLEQGRYKPLGEWIDSLPRDVIGNDPWLLYWKGASLSQYNPPLARNYSEQAFDLFLEKSNLPGALLAWSGIVYSLIYGYDSYSSLDLWISRFPELKENPEMVIPPEIWIRVVSAMFLSLTFRDPAGPATESWKRQTELLIQRPCSPVTKAQILLQLVHYYVIQGDFEHSFQSIRSLKDLARSKGVSPFLVIMANTAEAMHYGLSGEYDNCLRAVTSGLKTSENNGIFLLYYLLLAHGTANYQNMGDLEMAGDMLEKISSTLDRVNNFAKGAYHLVQGRQYLLESRLKAADIQAGLALETIRHLGMPDLECLAHLLAAQVMYGRENHLQAWEHLRQAGYINEKVKSKIFEYYGLMIEAHFKLEQGEEDSALTSLRKALALGEKGGFLNTFIDQPAVTAKLCIKALEEKIEVPYVLEIIRKRRVIPDKPPVHLEIWPWPIRIYTLGRFDLLKEGEPVQFQRKIQKKPLLMLKALIALGGEKINGEYLTDLLWPEADGDQAYSAYTTTLSRLRQLMGEKALEVRAGRVSLDPRYCWVDVWSFNHFSDKSQDSWKARQKDKRRAEALSLTEKAVEIYRGPFLAGEESSSFWAIPLREKLKDRFLLLIEKWGDYLEEAGQWEKAIAIYQNALEVDNLAEEFYRRLMACYGSLGETVKATLVYRRLKSTLASLLGIEPSPNTKTLYQSLTSTPPKTSP